MGKVNCTVRGEDWGWPVGDSDMPTIPPTPPWSPDGELLACLAAPVSYDTWVGYGEDTAYLAGYGDYPSGVIGDYVAWLNTETGEGAAYKVSGNDTDMVGCFGIDNNMFGLLYEDRFYEVSISGSSPAVEAEYEISLGPGFDAVWDISPDYAVFRVAVNSTHNVLHIYNKSSRTWKIASLVYATHWYPIILRAFGDAGLVLQGYIPGSPIKYSNLFLYSFSGSATDLGIALNEVTTPIPGPIIGNYAYCMSHPSLSTWLAKVNIFTGAMENITCNEGLGTPHGVLYVTRGIVYGNAAYNGLVDTGMVFQPSLARGLFITVDPRGSIWGDILSLWYSPTAQRYVIAMAAWGEDEQCADCGRLAVYSDVPKEQDGCDYTITHSVSTPDSPSSFSNPSAYSFSFYDGGDWLQTPSTSKPLTFTAI